MLVPQRRPAAFLSPNLQTRGAVQSTRQTLPALHGAHHHPSPQNCTTWQGAARPSPPPPNPQEKPCCTSIAQPSNESRCPIQKAAVADTAPHASPQSRATRLGATRPPLPTPAPWENTLLQFCRPTCKRGALSCPQDGSSHLPTPSLPLNCSAHQASATCARQYLPEELVVLQIAGLLPAILVLLPLRLDVTVHSSCRFGGERWPW